MSQVRTPRRERATPEVELAVASPPALDALLRVFVWLPIPAWVLTFVQYRDGGNSIIRQHDNLDSYVPIFHRMTLGDLYSYPGETLPYLLGGLDRDFVGSEFHMGIVIAVVLPTVWGLLINELLIRSLAFFGMRSLLIQIGLSSRSLAVYLGATLFSLIPFFLPAFGAVAGFPLLLAAFLRVYDQRALEKRTIAAVVLFPLYAAMPYTIPYLVIIGGAVLVAWIFFDRSAFVPLLKATGLLVAAIAVVDWRYIFSALGGTETHRVEQIAASNWNSAIWDGFLSEFTVERRWTPIGKSTVLVVTIVVGLAILLAVPGVFSRRRRRVFLLGCLSVPAMFVVRRLWPNLESSVVANIFDSWGRFRLSRLLWAEPTVVYMLFTLSLAAILGLGQRLQSSWRWAVTAIVIAVVAAQGVTLVDQHQFRLEPESLSIRQYYAEGSLGEFRSVIEADGGEFVVSIGLHPAVAIYNGIDSADGYWNVYELDYKHRFRRLIEPALAQSDLDRSYFDDFGSRVYVFQPEMQRPTCCAPPKHNPFAAVLNVQELAPLGITHVIASGPVLNADDLGLELAHSVDDPDELGPLYLYRVTPD